MNARKLWRRWQCSASWRLRVGRLKLDLARRSPGGWTLFACSAREFFPDDAGGGFWTGYVQLDRWEVRYFLDVPTVPESFRYAYRLARMRGEV